MYEDFFRVHVNGAYGETVLLKRVGETYNVAGGTLRVVGLSELGQKANPDEGIYYLCFRLNFSVKTKLAELIQD